MTLFESVKLRFVKHLKEKNRVLFVCDKQKTPHLFNTCHEFICVCNDENKKTTFFQADPRTIWISGFLAKKEREKGKLLKPGTIYTLRMVVFEHPHDGDTYVNTVFCDIHKYHKTKTIKCIDDLREFAIVHS